MSLFMDVHSLGNDVRMDDVARAHAADPATGGPRDLHHLRSWVNEANGLVPDEISAVQEGS